MFSIIIPTFNNLDYVKILLLSLKKNSTLNHEIIFHVNEGSDGTINFLNKNNYKYTFSKKNLGLCTGTNLAASKATSEYILYSHDDMYFCPGWDKAISKEINRLDTKAFYISGKLDSSYSAWYSNGSKKEEGDYVKGVQTGHWTFWHENGELKKILEDKGINFKK